MYSLPRACGTSSRASSPSGLFGPRLELPQVKWLLGRARFGLGLSYHFHVFLLSQGIPTIGPYTNPYYDIKLHGVFAAFDHTAAPFEYGPRLLNDPAFQRKRGDRPRVG